MSLEWTFLIPIICFLIVFLFYYKRVKTSRYAFKILLPLIRAFLVALLTFYLAKATFGKRWEEILNPKLILMLDASKSMSLPAKGEQAIQKSVWDTALDLINEQKFIGPLLENFDLYFYLFDSHSKLYGIIKKGNIFTSKSLSIPSIPRGDGTDILNSLREVNIDHSLIKPSAVLALTDGIFPPDFKIPDDFQMSYPVFILPLDFELKEGDIAIEEVQSPDSGILGEILPVKIKLKKKGNIGKNWNIEIKKEDKVLFEEKLDHKWEGDKKTVEINLILGEEGEHFLKANLSGDEDLLKENNGKEFLVKIIKEKKSVLFLAGSIGWEFAFIKRALENIKSIEVEYIIDKGLKNTRELYSELSPQKLGKIDAIIASDLNASFLPSFFMKTLIGEVKDNGLGIGFLGGKKLSIKGTPLTELFPKGAEVKYLQNEEEVVVNFNNKNHPLLNSELEPSFNKDFLRFADRIKGYSIINLFPLNGLILLESQINKTPILGVWDFGKGKVLFLATDTSWLWGFKPEETERANRTYRNFWGNAIFWIGRNKSGNQIEIEVEKKPSDKDKFDIFATIRDENLKPVGEALVKGSLFKIANNEEELIDDRIIFSAWHINEGIYCSTISIPYGRSKLVIKAIKNGNEIARGEKLFLINKSDNEFSALEVNWDFLEQLTLKTGGGIIDPKQIKNIINKLQRQNAGQFVRVRIFKNPPIYFFILFLLLLMLEWIIRKLENLK